MSNVVSATFCSVCKDTTLNKTKTKRLSVVSVMVPNNISIIYNIPLPCIVTMSSLINTFDTNILKACGDDTLSLCKPEKQC